MIIVRTRNGGGKSDEELGVLIANGEWLIDNGQWEDSVDPNLNINRSLKGILVRIWAFGPVRRRCLDPSVV